MHRPLSLRHITANIDEFGGPRYTVPALCEALAQAGQDVHLHVLQPCPQIDEPAYRLHAHARSRWLSRIGGSAEMKQALREAVGTTDLFHTHSLWLRPNHYPEEVSRGAKRRLVVSPRGTLAPGAMRWNWWRKWPFWLLTQRSNLQRADCLHATSELEYEDIRNLGFRAPVMFLPNGVRIPQLTQPKTATERRRLLYLGRVHPTKGIDRVLRSWARLQQQHVDWELRIVGPDIAGHTAELRTLAAELGLQRTTFVGTVSEEQKTIEYRSAELFVLATHHDNWAVTVAEALAHELPVVVSKAAPWSGVETHDCGWWVDGDVDSLSETLQAALERQPEQLLAMGHRGRNWLRDAFAWPVVAQQTLEVYRWLVHGGTAPNSVRFD